MIDRLDEINTDLIARRGLAESKGWLGELEGIDLTLRFLQDKRADALRLVALGPTNFDMPAFRPRTAQEAPQPLGSSWELDWQKCGRSHDPLLGP